MLNFVGFLCSFHFPKVEKISCEDQIQESLRGIPEYSGIIHEYSGIIPEFRNNETARAQCGVSGVVE
jgi:hypothetical protein